MALATQPATACRLVLQRRLERGAGLSQEFIALFRTALNHSGNLRSRRVIRRIAGTTLKAASFPEVAPPKHLARVLGAMEQPQSQRRRVITSLAHHSHLDAEDFDSMVMQLLTPNSECGDVLRTSDGWIAGGLKGNWQVSTKGALRDTADAQGGARAAPQDAGACREPAVSRWSAFCPCASSNAPPAPPSPSVRDEPKETKAFAKGRGRPKRRNCCHCCRGRRERSIGAWLVFRIRSAAFGRSGTTAKFVCP